MVIVKALGGSSVKVISTSKSSSKPSKASRSGGTKALGSSTIKETRDGVTKTITPEDKTQIPENASYKVTYPSGETKYLSEQGYKVYQAEQQRKQNTQNIINQQLIHLHAD